MQNVKSKNNSVGDMYEINLEKNTIYNIFTKKGNYRGGKKYFNDKKIIILSGKIKLISFDGNNDIEEYFSIGDFFEIKKEIPHIFYFEEESEIIEIFPKNTKTEKFEKYYNLKD